jgi:hypothetical protein
LKIYHALKETSYLTDECSLTGSGRIATTIGNYFSDPIARRADDFASIIYNKPRGGHDAIPSGETKMPQGSQPGEES